MIDPLTVETAGCETMNKKSSTKEKSSSVEMKRGRERPRKIVPQAIEDETVESPKGSKKRVMRSEVEMLLESQGTLAKMMVHIPEEKGGGPTILALVSEFEKAPS